jgi:N-acetylmuramoyl-L-alanine amidase
MDGISVNIDPAPLTIGALDPTFEVARRLRSLLEASGAVVKVLRSADASTATEADRALAAADSSASVSIGLSVASSGAAGRLVASPTSMPAPAGPASESLAVLIADKLAPVAPPVSRVYAQADSVLGMSSAPWVRVTLGSAGVRADETAFADPAWADSVARAVYSAIGELHGQRVAP